MEEERVSYLSRPGLKNRGIVALAAGNTPAGVGDDAREPYGVARDRAEHRLLGGGREGRERRAAAPCRGEG